MKKIKHIEYLIITFIVTIIFLSLAYKYKVYPFGTTLFSASDGGQQVIPMYYHIWDVLHGLKSLSFDWYTGFGNSLSGNIIHYGLLSPINLFLYFIKRDQIENYYTFLLLIRYLLLSCSMMFFINYKYNNLNIIYKMIFSLLYAFNGYTMAYSIFPMWLDVAILFPILITFLLELFDDKGTLKYILTLSLTLVISVNLSWAIILFLVMFSFGYIYLFKEKNERNRISFRLGITTIISILISSIIIIPGIIHIFSSQRMSISFIDNIKIGYKILNFTDFQKWTMISLLGIPISISFTNLINKKINKQIIFWLIFVIILSTPILVEGSNLVWHMGSFAYFSMRFAFMLQFVTIVFAIETVTADNTTKFKYHYLILYILVGMIYLLNLKYKHIVSWQQSYKYLNYFSLAFLISSLALLLKKIKFEKLSLLFFTMIFIIYTSNNLYLFTNIYDRDITTTYDTLLLQDKIENKQILNRTKVLHQSLNHNYPLILRQSSASNYLHLVSDKQLKIQADLGYSQSWTRMSDTGGTLISDIFFNYNTIISTDKLDYPYLKQINNTENHFIYENDLKLSFPVFINKDDINITLNKSDIENNGTISTILFNKNYIDSYLFDNIDNFTFNLEEDSLIYFSGYTNSGFFIKVNDNEINIPDLDNPTNKRYPGKYVSGIILLGHYPKGEISIDIVTDDVYYAAIGIISDQSIKEIQNLPKKKFDYSFSKNSISFNVESDKEQYLYLPIYANDGWKCINNNKEVKITKLFDAMMLIPVNKGINNINLKYTPIGHNIGLAFSIFGILLYIIYKKHKLKIENIKFINLLSYIFLFISFCFIFLITMIIPIMHFINLLIK